jgi:hypothetical protein
MNEDFNSKNLKFEFDLSQCKFELDVLQNKILQTYLRADNKFRRAFSQNYTSELLQFIRDKTRLQEPTALSVMGATRGGKSYSMMSLAGYHQACYGKKFTIDYVCANAFEFMEKLKTFPQNKLSNRIFLIDEEKQAVYSYGSIAKKMKLEDLSNIISINDISTISVNPQKWVNPESSQYGLRIWGRDFKNKIVRMMLYNLQERGRGAELPLGCVYLPIFTVFLPYAQELEKAYLKKKNTWVMQEQRSETDTLAMIRKEKAQQFIKDKNYMQIKSKKLKLSYITSKNGSEWTSKENEDILNLTFLLEQGFLK